MTGPSNFTYFRIEAQDRHRQYVRIFLCYPCRTDHQLYHYLLRSRRTRTTILRTLQRIQSTHHEPFTIYHPLFTIPLTLYHEACDQDFRQILQLRIAHPEFYGTVLQRQRQSHPTL